MPDNNEPHPARRPRGSLSARQWQEIRQAARLARSEGVEVSRFGFTFRPAPGSQTSRRPGEPEARGTAEPRPSMRQLSTRNVRRAVGNAVTMLLLAPGAAIGMLTRMAILVIGCQPPPLLMRMHGDVPGGLQVLNTSVL